MFELDSLFTMLWEYIISDINECEPSTWPKSIKYQNLFPCHGGKCRDVDGDYECDCNFGQRGDGKSDKGCEPVLSSAAVVVIGKVDVHVICSRNKYCTTYIFLLGLH